MLKIRQREYKHLPLITGVGSTLVTLLPPPSEKVARPIPKEDENANAALFHIWENVGKHFQAACEKLCEETGEREESKPRSPTV